MLHVLDVQEPGEGECDDGAKTTMVTTATTMARGEGDGQGSGGGKSGGDGDGGEMSAVLPVRLAEVRRVLAADTVIKVLWQVSPEGAVDIWPALLIEVLKRVVRVRWLSLLEGNVLIIDEGYAEESCGR